MTTRADKHTLLVISQVYVPDPASVGQHLADAAEEMARRGYAVKVLTSRRGYDDPRVKYPAREFRNGVRIIRLPFSSFGKRTLFHRLVGQSLFLLQSILRGVFTRHLTAILVSTSPPMCSFAALFISLFRRVKIKYWVMDLNPDQLIALGRLNERSLVARVFNAMNRRILKRATDIVTMDRFMAERLNRKLNVAHKMRVIPPWAHQEHLQSIPHAENPFRKEHGLQDKFVFMYSGNHGFSTPVTTVLKAALQLENEDDIRFLFVGGGVGKREVDEVIETHKLRNILSLPYQPLENLRYSLSAADVHIVTVGDTVVGVVHPCKIYGAMTIARPILLVAPDPCHASDIVTPNGIGWQIAHGDVDTAVNTIREIRATPPDQLEAMGQKARQIIESNYNPDELLGLFADVVERGL